jgi:hypothetical protein
MFFEQLYFVQARHQDLFSPGIDVENDFGLLRSGRRGFTMEAANQGVAAAIIEMICRWRNVQRAQGCAPNLGIREHYMEVSQSLETHLQYSCLL